MFKANKMALSDTFDLFYQHLEERRLEKVALVQKVQSHCIAMSNPLERS